MPPKPSDQSAPRSYEACLARLAPLRSQLLAHPVHRSIDGVAALGAFMEHHVWAVWDFMSIVKAIQSRVLCVGTPWTPRGDPAVRRFINEIVLLEESDETSLGVLSHFELYRLAMQQLGADVGPIDETIGAIASGAGIDRALDESRGPAGAVAFSRQTLTLARDGGDAALLGVFTFTREELIPDLFRAVVSGLSRRGGRVGLLVEYLDRHIEVDEGVHGPLARRMVESVCQDRPERWNEALIAADAALRARLALWDAALHAIRTTADAGGADWPMPPQLRATALDPRRVQLDPAEKR